MASEFELTTLFGKANRHELALRNSGYSWTLLKKLAFGDSVEDVKQMGKVAYLITKGNLTFNRKDKPGRAAFTGRNKIVHLGVQDQGRDNNKKRAILQRQHTVQKDGLYDLEAKKTMGCSFVEGHVCLSPAFAIELLQAGHIHWLDAGGEEVSNATIVDLLKETTIESHTVRVRGKAGTHMRFTVTVPHAETDQYARELQLWFEREWDGYEKKRGDTRKVDTATLYRSPAKADEHIDKSAAPRKVGGGNSEGEGTTVSRTLSFGSSL